MPIQPGATEDEQTFIGRCMSDEADSFPDEAQRYAVCKSKWDRQDMSKIKDTTEKVMARVAFETKYAGINLMAEDGLDSACWDGYEAIGTKMLDGREVPNCVPITE
jgi:hypothetical protein